VGQGSNASGKGLSGMPGDQAMARVAQR
jgi:hypothetical protein